MAVDEIMAKFMSNAEVLESWDLYFRCIQNAENIADHYEHAGDAIMQIRLRLDSNVFLCGDADGIDS